MEIDAPKQTPSSVPAQRATIGYEEHASPKATLHGRAAVAGEHGGGSATALFETAAFDAIDVELVDLEADETMDASAVGGEAPTLAHDAAGESVRTTVLPRRRKGQPEAATETPTRARFRAVRTLGAGAMGEVELVRDNDIRRTVAVKRLRADAQSEQALMRFADEVRIVGQLEHPSIVPIYDVGRDEDGKIYLVMKHLRGETMEQIIEKLRLGDRAYHAKYTISYRVHLFLAILDAVRYAHSRGVLHRDLKPANIIIGPYGEVTVIDWGIAKRTPSQAPLTVDSQGATALESGDERMLETREGAIAGTPFYMSPEQAAGRTDEIDERSDVYALVMTLYEWLVTRHPIEGKSTVQEVLAWVITHDYGLFEISKDASAEGVPAEYMHVLYKGLKRDAGERFQSVEELESRLKRVLDGVVLVQCHTTLAKRSLHGIIHWIDAHPRLYMALFMTLVIGLPIALVVTLIQWLS